ncbi:MAG: MerR family transcriptional regulator [Actinobacteria bacterium]|nr:MerR family transcriptional regulator [Actinomycetota bacterium]
MARGSRPVYVISIAASLAGCHPRTLRIYEEVGLLEPVRTQTNIRLYSDADLARVRCIRYLTQVRGVNLAGVKLLLRFRDADELLDELAALQAEGDGDEQDAEAAAKF